MFMLDLVLLKKYDHFDPDCDLCLGHFNPDYDLGLGHFDPDCDLCLGHHPHYFV